MDKGKKKKPTFPKELNLLGLKTEESLVVIEQYFNQLIDYIKYLEERIFKLEKGDNS